MNNSKAIIGAILCLSALPLSAQRANQIYVDAGTLGHDVSPSMYGTFFEEINHAGDGGLYAEMLQNRGFEEQEYPSGMTLKEDGRLYAPHSPNYWHLGYNDLSMSWDTESLKWKGWEVSSSGCTLKKDVVRPDVPLHEGTPNALRLNITSAGSTAKVTIDNTGYWGVAYKKGDTYRLRFYLKTSNFNGKVMAQLASSSGSNIGVEAATARTYDVIADGQWHEYTDTLTANQTVSNGKFRLTLTSTDRQGGEVFVDYVSLFPTDTYKGRANGLRRDVAEMLEALHPAFMRWPGGCIVEGMTLENRVKWKETLGDPMTRRGEYSLWGYRSTYGLGYHEFLQMCEDMGMDGMFVGNVGMSCSIRNGDFIEASDTKGLEPFRQDIEDAIEYALGTDPTNEWVQKRITAGHPDPFPLKYVELGNENGSDRYVKRYAYFYDYLKNKYPQITFINTLSWTDDGLFKQNDMYDVHWYVEPDYFYNSSSLFDNAKRGNYTVYAGEYATNNDVGSGNMDAALSEAAFIGFMERNSDLVTMASYAPLLTNVNAPNWHCNLIWFDNQKVMGRASYYVQKMYADHRPDYNVKTRIFGDAQKLMSDGKIGLGTWSTQAKFRNLRVTSNDGSELYYESDFANRQDDWTEAGGTWGVSTSGEYQQKGTASPCLSFLNAYAFRNCTIEFEALKTGGSEGFMVCFGTDTTDVSNHYRINIGGWSNTKTSFQKVSDGYASDLGDKVSCKISTNKWYKVKVVMKEGDGIYCYLNDELHISYKTNDTFDGRIQAFGGYDEKAGEMVVKVVNGLTTDQTTRLHINAAGIESTGSVTTLKAKSLTEENSLSTPKKIYPVESTFNGFAEEFDYTFPACSFTILRFKTASPRKSSVAPSVIPAYDYDSTPVALSEAKVARAAATKRLQTLIDRHADNVVDGATRAVATKKALTTAQQTLESGEALIKDLQKAADNLQSALDSYYAGLMLTKNEKTSLIQNPNFTTMSNTGWSGTKPSLEHNVGEFFNKTFDSYQTLKGLDDGYYLLYVQAFYRNGGTSEAYQTYIDGRESANALLYAGSRQVPICSLYDFQTGSGYKDQYPDNREQSEKAFNKGIDCYANYLVVRVEGGQLKFGMKKSKTVTNDWVCFNNYRLFKMNVTVPTGILGAKANGGKAGTYNLSGVKMSQNSALPSGVYIRNGKKIAVK